MKSDSNSKQTSMGKVEPRELTAEMRESYLDYAMSVIVSRALPDVRDGLKPVHRRILFAMNELGLRHNAKFVKSARIIGEVLGKYHPHGDMAVYDAMVRLAQPWSMRYPLVQGQGNFGSIDADSPAAQRYTEARLTALAEELLADIDRETVDFGPNYDNTRQEPKVLPAKAPQLLLNGTTGIAVGMATSIPPHNLSEIVDAAVHLIDNPEATTVELMEFVKGPDFPTGGVIYNQKAILEAYASGRGAITSRGVAEIEEGKGSRYQIIIKEIPYLVSKAALVERIAELVRDKKLEGIRDIRDESDREGMRVVIELKSDAQPQKILNNLYQHTDLQKTFHLNMLALVEGLQPQTLSLKAVLEQFLKHRFEVVTKRAKFDLAKAQERAHILEGLLKALHQIDAVIKTIKSSANREAARANLIKKFELTERQAEAILEMKLASLAALEQQKIEDELKEKLALIKELIALLKDVRKVGGVIKTELKDLKEKFGDERRTKLVKGGLTEFREEDLVAAEEVLVTLSFGGYVKRMSPDVYRLQKRGGKGVMGATVKEEDPVEHFLTVNTHDTVLFFSTAGKQYTAKAYEIPEGSRQSRGKALVNILNLGSQERVSALVRLSETKTAEKGSPKYFVMATRNGKIKKTAVEEFRTNRRNGLLSIKLQKGDELAWVAPTSGSDEVILTTKQGMSIRFSEKDVRAMGRAAAGVGAIRLKQGDEVVGMDVINPKAAAQASLLVLTANGFGKRTKLSEYRLQSRGGSGVSVAKITERTGPLAIAFVVTDQEELVTISEKAQVVRVKLAEVSELGRATQGVRVMKLEQGDKLASATLL